MGEVGPSFVYFEYGLLVRDAAVALGAYAGSEPQVAQEEFDVEVRAVWIVKQRGELAPQPL